MVRNYGLSDFSRYENFAILSQIHESNVEKVFFRILAKRTSWVFLELHFGKIGKIAQHYGQKC